MNSGSLSNITNNTNINVDAGFTTLRGTITNNGEMVLDAPTTTSDAILGGVLKK